MAGVAQASEGTAKVETPFRRFVADFTESKLALGGLIVFAIVFVAAMLCAFITLQRHKLNIKAFNSVKEQLRWEILAMIVLKVGIALPAQTDAKLALGDLWSWDISATPHILVFDTQRYWC